MKFSFMALLLLAGVLSAGMVSGTVFYSGPETDLIVAACVEEGMTEIDLMTIPATTLEGPGTYRITHDDLVDGTNYWCMSLMLIGMSAASGNPAGMHPSVVTLSDGTAEGIDITLATTANIGGVVSYTGNPNDIYINVYDAYNEFMGGEAVLESTHRPGSNSYLLTGIPSGPKKIQAFADANGNGALDEGELSSIYVGPFGETVIVGGGGLSDTGVDLVLGTGVEENVVPKSFALSVTPNPFNSACRIDSPAEVEIFDMGGRKIDTIDGGGIWNGTDVSGATVPAGIYLAKTSFEGKAKSVLLIFAK